MVERNAHINATDVNGDTPLHVAAKNSFDLCVRRLTQLGANTRAINKVGMTPLHLAAAAGHVPTILALLEADRSVINVEDLQARNFLLFTCHMMYTNCIYTL